MTKHYAAALLVLSGVAWTDRVAAQPGPAAFGPGMAAPARPVFSPYLNLARPGSSPAVNYFGLVRPQLATQNSLQSLQRQVMTEQQQRLAGPSAVNPTLPITGQQTFFLNTGGYFLNNRGGGVPLNQNSMSQRALPSRPPRAR